MVHHKNLANLSGNLLSSQPMSKMIAQLLVGVSIVSSLLKMYPENLNYFSWRYSFQMILGQVMSKNCVFLICNGLLVFVVKTSGVVRSPSGAFDPNDVLQAEIWDGPETAVVTESEPHVAVEISELPEDIAVLEENCECNEEDDEDDDDPSIAVLEENCECKEEDEDEDYDDGSIEVKEVISEITSNSTVEISDEEEKHESCLLDDKQNQGGREDNDNDEDEEVLREEAKEEEQEYVDDHGEVDGEEEEDYVDEMEKMSTEELNKKFEDFIRRMKEEFRINNINEATRRQQLVMVN